MAKRKTAYVCSECGAQFPRWQGQCTECKEWNSITEFVVSAASPVKQATSGYAGQTQAKIETLNAIDLEAWVEQLYRHTDRRKTAVAVGCKVDHIDVESLAALRQLILLNSGDPSMSQDDIDTLTSAIYGNASNASQS